VTSPFRFSVGLAARRHISASSQTLGTWTYGQSLVQAPAQLTHLAL